MGGEFQVKVTPFFLLSREINFDLPFEYPTLREISNLLDQTRFYPRPVDLPDCRLDEGSLSI